MPRTVLLSTCARSDAHCCSAACADSGSCVSIVSTPTWLRFELGFASAIGLEFGLGLGLGCRFGFGFRSGLRLGFQLRWAGPLAEVLPLVREERDEQRLQVDVVPRVALDEC